MNKLMLFLKDGSGKRTQFFIVLGFIIIPIISLSVVFYYLVIKGSNTPDSSERLKIPQEIIHKIVD